MPDPARILIIKPSAIGDVVHTLPIWNLLRQHWPAAKISWVISPACAGMIEGLPDLEIIRFDRRRWGKAWRSPSIAAELFAFSRNLRRRKFDLVIDLQGLFRSAWMAWQTRAPIRIGFRNAREGAWLFYNRRVPIDNLEQHAIQRYLKLIAALGVPTAPVEFHFPLTDAHRQAITQKLSQSGMGVPTMILPSTQQPHPVMQSRLPGIGRYAVLLPGANWPTKRWPVDRYAALVSPLRERFGLVTVVAGGPHDRQLANQIPNALNLAGQTSLMELTALLERADLVIANDTGPMHIAAVLGRPLVTIFGPTNPIRTGPWLRPETVIRANLQCSPCYSRSCDNCRCMQELDVEAVLAHAKQVCSTSPNILG